MNRKIFLWLCIIFYCFNIPLFGGNKPGKIIDDILIINLCVFDPAEDYYNDLHLGNIIRDDLTIILFDLCNRQSFMETFMKNKEIKIAEDAENSSIQFKGTYAVSRKGEYSFSFKKMTGNNIIVTIRKDYHTFINLLCAILFEIIAYNQDTGFYANEETYGKIMTFLIENTNTFETDKKIQRKIDEYRKMMQSIINDNNPDNDTDTNYFIDFDPREIQTIPIQNNSPERETSKIQGKIYDEVSKSGISHAQIETNPPTESVITNVKGEYTIVNVKPGIYRLKATADNYSFSDVLVQVGWNQVIQADLPLFPLSLYKNPYLACGASLCIPGLGQILVTKETDWGLLYMLTSTLPALFIAADFLDFDIYSPIGINTKKGRAQITIGSGIFITAVCITSGIHAYISAKYSNKKRNSVIR